MLLQRLCGRPLAVGVLLLAGLQGLPAHAQAGAGGRGAFSVLIKLANPAAVLAPGLVNPTPANSAASASGPGLLVNGYAQSLCVGASFAAPTTPTVRVVCGGGEFVAIAPHAGGLDAGRVGEVSHTRFGPGAGRRPDWAAHLRPSIVAGSGASYQVQRLPDWDWDDPLQLVVSF